jgi:lipopolysaccharide export system protein LptA
LRPRARGASVAGILVGALARAVGALALALALGASVPRGVLAQDSAQSGAAATQGASPTEPGASIRKPQGGAADAGAGAAAAETAGASASPSAPAALATPVAHAKTKAKAKAKTKANTKTKTKTGAAAHSKADQKADSKADAKAGKDAKGAQDSPFSALQFSGNKGPIDIKADTLNLDYKHNVVTFTGHVHAVQADATLTSDSLTVTYGKDFHEVEEMVANDNVRMSQGTRWATGDHAVLDQAKHTVTLTGSPVVHDGQDQVAGTKITVHLDTGKSEVEGGARAVFFPNQQKTRDNKTAVAKSSAKSSPRLSAKSSAKSVAESP